MINNYLQMIGYLDQIIDDTFCFEILQKKSDDINEDFIFTAETTYLSIKFSKSFISKGVSVELKSQDMDLPQLREQYYYRMTINDSYFAESIYIDINQNINLGKLVSSSGIKSCNNQVFIKFEYLFELTSKMTEVAENLHATLQRMEKFDHLLLEVCSTDEKKDNELVQWREYTTKYGEELRSIIRTGQISDFTNILKRMIPFFKKDLWLNNKEEKEKEKESKITEDSAMQLFTLLLNLEKNIQKTNSIELLLITPDDLAREQKNIEQLFGSQLQEKMNYMEVIKEIIDDFNGMIKLPGIGLFAASLILHCLYKDKFIVYSERLYEFLTWLELDLDVNRKGPAYKYYYYNAILSRMINITNQVLKKENDYCTISFFIRRKFKISNLI